MFNYLRTSFGGTWQRATILVKSL